MTFETRLRGAVEQVLQPVAPQPYGCERNELIDRQTGQDAVADRAQGEVDGRTRQPAADPTPLRARQPIAQRRVARGKEQHEDDQVHRDYDRRDHARVFLPHRQRGADGTADEQEKDHDRDDEAAEQLAAGAGVFEAVAVIAGVRPEIAAIARAAPEPVDAERDDAEQQVDEEDAVQLSEPAVVSQALRRLRRGIRLQGHGAGSPLDRLRRLSCRAAGRRLP